MSDASDIFDTNGPTETRNGHTAYRELTAAGDELTRLIDQWLDTHPGQHPPNRIARGVNADTLAVRSALAWMHDHAKVAAAGRGARRRYASLRH
ncbi:MULTISPECIES: hypothetical protein [Mycolicibacterium]|uniref:hypothetical protein n=1 Tax=Mycolicibacterium TaxID=1866885 RepID=UPI001CDD62CE|nr:hypothetical protein [Mycolicibacterium fortuitum]UBV20405.1 hypothetical protein H8Z59_24535 [Mycolicibacterium fortuitum]